MATGTSQITTPYRILSYAGVWSWSAFSLPHLLTLNGSTHLYHCQHEEDGAAGRQRRRGCGAPHTAGRAAGKHYVFKLPVRPGFNQCQDGWYEIHAARVCIGQ
ncbi:hypothetical protein WJX81_004934 [Elliptochloris bilobata]|uniref:Uncharacterized protein n=1 Tax=Elliptochloris bilobata TaxID=381761 RepID=A0AAW1SEC2_9CHLO